MMILSSSAFQDNQAMPFKYARAGGNVSPPLSWQDAPQGTKLFALILVDRHPVARNMIHWLVIDIRADVTALLEGASGTGKMPAGSREPIPYVGPFPPSGTHDYEFTLYALKTEKLDLPRQVSLEEFTRAAEQSRLSTAKLVGRFTKA